MGRKVAGKFCCRKDTMYGHIPLTNDSQMIQGRLSFNGGTLNIDDHIDILGVEFDSKLTFSRHVNNLARKASSKISALRRMKQLLDKKGLCMLYKSQVRSHLEYSFLAWISCPRSHLALLDKVQRRAERLIASVGEQEEQPSLDSLEHGSPHCSPQSTGATGTTPGRTEEPLAAANT